MLQHPLLFPLLFPLVNGSSPFVDGDTGEEEYYDGEIDAIFVDGGVAHYHVVYDDLDLDEEEVYRDEAIALLLAVNGFD